MTGVAIAWLGIEALGLIDALRHSGAEWHYADRERSFWVVFIFFLGPIFVVPYLLLVRPRFPDRSAKQPADPFLKR